MMGFLKKFLQSYLEIPQDLPKIACLGGGTGLPNLLSGLKLYTNNLTAIVTMADEGGSSGRLRRILGVPPVGDVRNCLVALSNSWELSKILNYRFPGYRYGADTELGGHALGNLILAALADISGNFNQGLQDLSRILNIAGKVLPATSENVRIWAETSNGQKVYGEENIDLGRYNNKREIAKLHLKPDNAAGFKPAMVALTTADIICAGPGDLYTSIMPNLLISDIVAVIKKAKAVKIFILNIANKPFETPNYEASNYLEAVKKHCGQNLFDYIIVNNNLRRKIPKNLNYTYVKVDSSKLAEKFGIKVIKGDFQSHKNILHHDSTKLAKAVLAVL